MNEITLTGNVGREIRLNHSRENGTAVLSFSIAMNDRQFDRRTGEWVERPTVWQDVVAFGTRAENAYNTLCRGMAVVVIGNCTDGAAAVNFSVAVNRRRYDRQTGQWTDHAPVVHRVVAFGTLADNADNLTRRNPGHRHR